MTEEIMNEEESPEGDFPEYHLPEVVVPIKVHTIDSRGVYTGTFEVDPMGPQPPGGVYESEGNRLPEELEGHLRVRVGGAWAQVPSDDVPPIPEPVYWLPVPAEVSIAQCRLALFDKHGIETDDQFYALAGVLPEEARPRALLQLRTRTTVRYDNELVIAFCEAKGWDRDALFIYAANQ